MYKRQAKKLVTELKQAVGVPIQLHTHDTSGNQVATVLMAAEAGVDVADLAISSLSGLTSQPSLNAVVAALQGTERDTGLDLNRLQQLTDYWEDVRKRYTSFEAGLVSPATDIYRYEIPGGQYTNLKPQVESPVSYTHLDVYKRQALGKPASEILIFFFPIT